MWVVYQDMSWETSCNQMSIAVTAMGNRISEASEPQLWKAGLRYQCRGPAGNMSKMTALLPWIARVVDRVPSRPIGAMKDAGSGYR